MSTTTLIVSDRGQITLPAATRNRFGIKGGDVVVLEDRGNEIVLKPETVLQVDVYSDEQIAEWDAADRLVDAPTGVGIRREAERRRPPDTA